MSRAAGRDRPGRGHRRRAC